MNQLQKTRAETLARRARERGEEPRPLEDYIHTFKQKADLSNVSPVLATAVLTRDLAQAYANGRIHRPNGQPPAAVEQSGHEQFDISRVLAEMDTDMLDQVLADTLAEDSLFLRYAPLREDLVTMLVENVPMPEHQARPEEGKYPEIQVKCEDVCNLVVQTGRIQEFPERADAIMKVASEDVVNQHMMTKAREAARKHDQDAADTPQGRQPSP